MPIVNTDDERPPENLCSATTEYLDQLGKIGVRQLSVALWLKGHFRGNAPLSQEELETIIKESDVMQREIQSLSEVFEAHRYAVSCFTSAIKPPANYERAAISKILILRSLVSLAAGHTCTKASVLNNGVPKIENTSPETTRTAMCTSNRPPLTPMLTTP